MQKTLSERQKQIEAQRAASRALAQKAFAIDEIAKANKAYIDAEFAAMASGDDKAKTAEKAHEKYRKTLEKYGFFEKDFESKPSCPLCDDTGYAGGKVCSCVWDLYVENLKKSAKSTKEQSSRSRIATLKRYATRHKEKPRARFTIR